MERERPASVPVRIRDWPKISASVSPALLATLTARAKAKGYSLSHAVRLILERVGLADLDRLPPAAPAALEAPKQEHPAA